MTTVRTPRSASQRRVSSAPACAAGTVNSVPTLARTTLGLNRSVTGSQTISAAAPTASAVRSRVPRLPGFSIAVATTYSGSAGAAGRPSIRQSGVGATASNPSGRSRYESLANTSSPAGTSSAPQSRRARSSSAGSLLPR